MDKFNALKLMASTLAAGAVLATGATANDGHSASNSAGQAEMMQLASTSSAIARKAMASGKGALATQHAEKAVAAMPNDASYRLLLGEAYLSAGRFASAETAFSEALTLDQTLSKAGLKMALALAAQGKQTEALGVLEQHRELLNVGDYGLALVLAGDAGAAIQVLTTAARAPDASAKIRQNLAFAHAMSNNWALARTIAGQDLEGELVHKRIAQWAMLARPQTAADQVAGILGVKPAFDPGRPQALALAPVSNNGPTELATVEAPATTEQIAEAAPAVSMALAEEAPAPVATDRVAEIEAVSEIASAQTSNGIVFGPRQEIVQKIPESVRNPGLIRASGKPAKQQIVPAKRAAGVSPERTFEAGKFAVQLGAYGSVRSAERGWNRLSGRIDDLKTFDPQTARVRVKSVSLYRLSVTGFSTRDVAGQVCSKIKAAGGDCFIRSVAGDAPLQWALRKSNAGGTRLAARR